MNIRLNIDSLNIRPNIRLNVRKNAIQVKKDFYYSPSAEAGVFSTEIKKLSGGVSQSLCKPSN